MNQKLKNGKSQIMYKYLVKIFYAALILCLLSLCPGCEKSTAPVEKPKIVTQKIISEANKAVDKSKEMVALSKPEIYENTKGKPSDKTKKTAATAPAQLQNKTAVETSDMILKKLLSKEKKYDPRGKIDPFAPIIKEKPKVKAQKKVRKRRVPRTPLERIDLGQLKLAGVLKGKEGHKALVEEASGKGYIVTRGTYIGTQSGKVIDILIDRLIIEEEEENALGKVQIVRKELKLQKPLGE